MAQWRIEGETDRVYTCLSNACKHARTWARKVSNPATVRYMGPKESPNNDINRSDMLVYANGERDPRIDPTWYTNQGH